LRISLGEFITWGAYITLAIFAAIAMLVGHLDAGFFRSCPALAAAVMAAVHRRPPWRSTVLFRGCNGARDRYGDVSFGASLALRASEFLTSQPAYFAGIRWPYRSAWAWVTPDRFSGGVTLVIFIAMDRFMVSA
jgi:hypothetical protein